MEVALLVLVIVSTIWAEYAGTTQPCGGSEQVARVSLSPSNQGALQGPACTYRRSCCEDRRQRGHVDEAGEAAFGTGSGGVL